MLMLMVILNNIHHMLRLPPQICPHLIHAFTIGPSAGWSFHIYNSSISVSQCVCVPGFVCYPGFFIESQFTFSPTLFCMRHCVCRDYVSNLSHTSNLMLNMVQHNSNRPKWAEPERERQLHTGEMNAWLKSVRLPVFFRGCLPSIEGKRTSCNVHVSGRYALHVL